MTTPLPPCSLWRRLAAITYDTILLFGVLFLASALALPVIGDDAVRAGNPLYSIYMVLVAFGFFGWFWTHGGQTLGMKAWRVKIVSNDGRPVTWKQAGIRFVVALLSWGSLGLGFFWSAFHPQKRAWHDLASDTRLVVLP